MPLTHLLTWGYEGMSSKEYVPQQIRYLDQNATYVIVHVLTFIRYRTLGQWWDFRSGTRWEKRRLGHYPWQRILHTLSFCNVLLKSVTFVLDPGARTDQTGGAGIPTATVSHSFTDRRSMNTYSNGESLIYRQEEQEYLQLRWVTRLQTAWQKQTSWHADSRFHKGIRHSTPSATTNETETLWHI